MEMRLLFVDIQPCPGQPTFAERVDQGRLIHHRSARRVDEEGGRVHIYMRWFWGTDENAIVENDQRFAAQREFDNAIAEWRKLRTGQPTDSMIYNNIGDLYLKRHAPAEAVDAYFQAAAAFRAEGSTLKAIAVYRKILKVDPARYEVYRDLGDLIAERGLISNAISEYLSLTKRRPKEER